MYGLEYRLDYVIQVRHLFECYERSCILFDSLPEGMQTI